MKRLAICLALTCLMLSNLPLCAQTPPPAVQQKAVAVGEDEHAKKPVPSASGRTDSEENSLILPFKKETTLDMDSVKKQAIDAIDKLAAWDGLKPWKLICLFSGMLVTIILARLVRWLIESYLLIKLAGKTNSDIDDRICLALGRPAAALIYTLGLFISFLPVMFDFPNNIFVLGERLFLAIAAACVAWAIYRLSDIMDYILSKLAKTTDNAMDTLIVGIIRKIVKICIVLLSGLFIGQSILGLNITTLLAGAGVVGLAIAFAAQDTIANFFGSMMIIIDRPFKVGEFVKMDSCEGVVEKVGLRSTRLRTLSGHLITIPNKNAANAAVENITRRPSIKSVDNIGLVYDTTADKMQRAIDLLHEILDGHEGMSEDLPPRVHFTEFKDFSLNIQVITWYHPGDYFLCLDWRQKVNLEILRRFGEEGLEFAFPTSTTYLAYDPKRKLEVKIEGASGKS